MYYLYIDYDQAPLPAWLPEMEADPSATVFDFVARLAGEIRRDRSRFVADVKSTGQDLVTDILLSRCKVLSVRTAPIPESGEMSATAQKSTESVASEWRNIEAIAKHGVIDTDGFQALLGAAAQATEELIRDWSVLDLVDGGASDSRQAAEKLADAIEQFNEAYRQQDKIGMALTSSSVVECLSASRPGRPVR